MTAIGLLVAHREPIVGEALASALGSFQNFVSVGVISDAGSLDFLRDRFGVAVVDAAMDGGKDLARNLRRRGTRVVMLGTDQDDDAGVCISPVASVATLAAALLPGIPLRNRGDCLPITAREEEILSLAARGLPAKRIAGHLGISPKTVESHKSRAYKKLGVPNQAAAVSLVSAGMGDRDRVAAMGAL
ncbi:MAG: response regulator transcription factor [Actinomycetota bacterium]